MRKVARRHSRHWTVCGTNGIEMRHFETALKFGGESLIKVGKRWSCLGLICDRVLDREWAQRFKFGAE